MTIEEQIHLYVQKLPYSLQEELFDYLQYLLMKVEKKEIRDWSSFSLYSAMRDTEDEPALYSLADIKVKFA